MIVPCEIYYFISQRLFFSCYLKVPQSSEIPFLISGGSTLFVLNSPAALTPIMIGNIVTLIYSYVLTLCMVMRCITLGGITRKHHKCHTPRGTELYMIKR